MRFCSISVDLDEIPNYHAIHDLPSLSAAVSTLTGALARGAVSTLTGALARGAVSTLTGALAATPFPR